MTNLKYRKQYIGKSEWTDITYEDALYTLLGAWRDCDMTRDMLSIVNRIRCMYATIEVYEDDNGITKVLMAGLCNLVPMDVEYDDNGNRKQQDDEENTVTVSDLTREDYIGVIEKMHTIWHDYYVQKKKNPSDKSVAFIEEHAWNTMWALFNEYQEQYGATADAQYIFAE